MCNIHRKKIFNDIKFNEIVLLLFILIIPFQRLLNLPYFGNKFQLPEIFFFLLVIIAIKNTNSIFKKNFWCYLDIAVILWPIANILPSFFYGINKVAIIDIFGSIYLLILYFSIRIISKYIDVIKFYDYLIYSALLAGIIGIVGFLLSLINITTILAYTSMWPYLGKMPRIQAFTATPNMLASILMIGIILLCSKHFNIKKIDKKSLIILIILSIAFILTLSKTLMCLLAGLIVTWFVSLDSSRKTTLLKILISTLLLCIIVIYLLGTHFFFTNVKNTTKESFAKMLYFVEKDALFYFSIGSENYNIYPTNYLTNKKQSLRAIRESKPIGLGAGNYNKYIEELKKKGLHPSTFPNWDPHCTYLGVSAELGFFGLLAIILIWGLFGVYLNKHLSDNMQFKSFYSGLSGVYIAILIEATATDIMNFRHYWVLFAFMTILISKIKEQTRNN